MLTRLSIRNIVLIDALDLDFVGGLGVLTGETGAGKSILLDALGLVLGAAALARRKVSARKGLLVCTSHRAAHAVSLQSTAASPSGATTRGSPLSEAALSRRSCAARSLYTCGHEAPGTPPCEVAARSAARPARTANIVFSVFAETLQKSANTEKNQCF